MSDYAETRKQLEKAVKRVFPRAKPVKRWGDADAWGAPRPEAAIAHGSDGRYDPELTVIGIADRKAGPVVYFLDPGDFDLLDTHRASLEEAGLKLGRGCIMHHRKEPFPMDAVESLMRTVKARDAAVKPEKAVKKAAKTPAKKAEKKPAKKAAKRAAKAR